MVRDLSKLVDGRPLTLLPTKTERLAAKKKKTTEDTAGPAWFNMPAPKMTAELEADVRILSMRSALDPKQHYRRGEKILQGKYFQFGTVISDPTRRYSERLTRKKQGQSILETLMRDTEKQQYFKRKYDVLQEASLRSSRAPRTRKPAHAGNRRKDRK